MIEYYTPDSGGEIAFTVEERAYIQASKDAPITAVINPDRAPYSSFVNGVPSGMISAVANEVIARSGLNITIMDAGSREQYKKLIGERAADIRFDAWHDYDEAERTGYRLTAPYLELSVSRLYRRDKAVPESAALLRNSDLSGKYGGVLSSQYRNVTYYDTVDEIVEAVSRGKQDTAYLYSGTAELAVHNDDSNRLVAESLYGYTVPLCAAVSAKQDKLLYSIVDKTIASIDESDIEEIVRLYTPKERSDFSIVRFAYDNPLAVAAAVALLFVAAMLILTLIMQDKKRKRQDAQLAEEKRQSELLRDALASAERAGAVKSQFLSRVSHEMRTPLNAIIGFMTLAKGAEPEKVRLCLANSEIAAKQLLAVINDVLDMSSIESGKLKLSQAAFDFKLMVRSLTSIFGAQCEQKGLKYDTSLLTPVDEWLVGDQLRVN